MTAPCSWRVGLMMAVFLVIAALLGWRVAWLQLAHRDFLQDHGAARHLRVVDVPAHRGMILDRNGEPLAVSTPVSSIWAIPRSLLAAPDRLPELAALLDMDAGALRRYLEGRKTREFAWVRRRLDPAAAERVMALGLPGVFLQREFRRYFPAGEIAGQVVGFTDIDDAGQEGLELVYDNWLRGHNGRKSVIRDRLGRSVEDVESIVREVPGQDLVTSLDRRIQFIAYRELKASVRHHGAASGTAVVLDARSGEILAMVSQPAFNPNDPADRDSARFRNRPVTDVFEPGSTIKPFVVAAGLASGKYAPATRIDTSPGFFRIGAHTIRDISDMGRLNVSSVLSRSSNVGAAKIALSLPREALWNMFRQVGFGARTHSGLPGESAGRLRGHAQWHEVDHATMAFGYGLSVTTLQLAQAYLVLANGGERLPVSILRRDREPESWRVLRPDIAADIRRMLRAAVEPGGTGGQAHIEGYRVAGKTGTVHKSDRGGYASDRYVALFAGMAPAGDPRLVMAVMIDQPAAGAHYGGQVAAPVFSRVMSAALRVLSVPPTGARRLAGGADAQGRYLLAGLDHGAGVSPGSAR